MAVGQIQGNQAALVRQTRTAPTNNANQVVDQGGGQGNIDPALANNQLGAGWQNVATGANDQAPPVGAGKLLSELTDEELGKLGGDINSLKTLANADPNLTVGEAMPLIRRPDVLDSVADIVGTRSDLKVSDFVTRDKDGKIRIDPSVYDENARGLLKDRNDIKPSELSAMRANFARQLRNPIAAKQASESAMELMRERRDIRPEDASEMMGKMINAVGGTQGEGNQGAFAAVDMFKNAGELLKQRHDLDTGDMGRLAESMGKLGGKKDPNAAMNVATGFGAATQALAGRPDMPVDEMISLADTMKTRFPGDDAASGADRLQAFTQGAQMVAENPGLNAAGVDSMLARAAEGPPPKQGAKLLNAFNTMNQKLNAGEATIPALTDRNVPLDANAPKRDGDVRLNKHGQDAEATGEAPRPDNRPREERGPGETGDRQDGDRQGGDREGGVRPGADQRPERATVAGQPPVANPGLPA